MALLETMEHLNILVGAISKDLTKVHRGNRTAAQRIRVNTIRLEKVGKWFRKESLDAERGGKLGRPVQKRKKRKKR